MRTRFLTALVALLSTVACSDASPGLQARASDAGTSNREPDAGPTLTGLLDASADASATNEASTRPRGSAPAACKPGHYTGMFNCTIAGLLPWVGSIAFDLVADMEGSGEFVTLSIAPGTQISSDQDSMGGQFTGQLEATFDCQTGLLNGELVGGKNLFLGTLAYHFEGPLTGAYRSDGATPGFDGKLGTLTTSDFAYAGDFAPTGDCTFSTNADRLAKFGLLNESNQDQAALQSGGHAVAKKGAAEVEQVDEGAFASLRASLDPCWIEEALEATGTATLRRRRLPAEQVVWLVLGMALYRDRPIDELVERLDLVLPSSGAKAMAKSAVAQARDRLGEEPLKWLFERCAENGDTRARGVTPGAA